MYKKWKKCIAAMLAGMMILLSGVTSTAASADRLEGSFADDTSAGHTISDDRLPGDALSDNTILDDDFSDDTVSDDDSSQDPSPDQTGEGNADAAGGTQDGASDVNIQSGIIPGESKDVSSEIEYDTSADDNVVIDEDDKPYLALGANLTKEQKNTVLGLMGIDPANLDQYHVTTVTNEEEHQYLDEYLDASTIGTRALSSVVIVKRDKGDGIHISTKNISYCTVGMYKNALATAGLEDADVIVAGPFRLSGTAALIGAMKAYADMENKEVDAESLDAAMNEIVVTGELNQSLGSDAQMEEFIAFVKQKVVEGGKDIESIKKIIEDACKKFNISLSDSEKEKIISLMEKIGSLDINIDSLLEQAGSIYESLSNMEESSGFLAGIASFFRNLLDSIVSFFQGLF